MKTISVAVSEKDYEVFRHEARKGHLSIAQLIRDAMVLYRQARLQTRPRLEDFPVLPGHRMIRGLPRHEKIYDEMFGR